MPITGVRPPTGLVYVDRGSVSACDFHEGNLQLDTAYHNLDLSTIITDNDAVLAHLRLKIMDSSTNQIMYIRESASAGAENIIVLRTQTPNVRTDQDGLVALDSNLTCQYLIIAGMDQACIIVRGWFRPA